MKKKIEKPQQLDLGFKQPFFNFLHVIKYRLKNSFRIFDLMKYAKDPTVWLLNTASVSLITLQTYILITTYNRLPKILPLIEFYNIEAMKLSSRDSVFSIPALSTVILLTAIILSYRWYNREKELVKLLMFITTFSILVLTIHLLKIIAIY